MQLCSVLVESREKLARKAQTAKVQRDVRDVIKLNYKINTSSFNLEESEDEQVSTERERLVLHCWKNMEDKRC